MDCPSDLQEVAGLPRLRAARFTIALVNLIYALQPGRSRATGAQALTIADGTRSRSDMLPRNPGRKL